MHVTFDLYQLEERQVVGTFSFLLSLKEVLWVSPVVQSSG